MNMQASTCVLYPWLLPLPIMLVIEMHGACFLPCWIVGMAHGDTRSGLDAGWGSRGLFCGRIFWAVLRALGEVGEYRIFVWEVEVEGWRDVYCLLETSSIQMIQYTADGFL